MKREAYCIAMQGINALGNRHAFIAENFSSVKIPDASNPFRDRSAIQEWLSPAAAVLDIPTREGAGRGIAHLAGFESGLFPERREELRYRHEGGRLRNTLSRKVPAIGAKAGKEICERLLAKQRLGKADIDFWAVHPGGTLVLSQVAKKMELSEQDLACSYEVFERYGNMSSPSVLFVLKRIIEERHPQKGQKAMLLSFGAGFSAFASLLEFE